jgi:glutathione synthase
MVKCVVQYQEFLKKDHFLSNMSKGAKPINTKLTKLENKISKLIAKDLKKENIFFAGIDFIDQKLKWRY